MDVDGWEGSNPWPRRELNPRGWEGSNPRPTWTVADVHPWDGWDEHEDDGMSMMG